MSVIVVGTMAFDEIETPFGKSGKIIGGSATFIAWTAANFVQPINQISVVGGDFPQADMNALAAKGVALEGVQIKKDRPSFYWAGKYHMDMNTRDTLVTELNVLGDFQPEVPESYQGSEFLVLGNLSPQVQISVINQLRERPKLIVLDTMNFWMETAMDDLKKVLTMVDVLLVNDGEARQLSGEYSLVKAARKILTMGPPLPDHQRKESTVHCCSMRTTCSLHLPLPLEDVFDPTGAGDTFAGGFIGHLAKTKDISFENMKTAIIVGSAMASFCVEKFGTGRLREITQEDISARLEQFVELVNFDIDLV